MVDFVVNSITALETGTILRDPKVFFQGYQGKEVTLELPVYSYLLDTSGGYLLVDTGFHQDIHTNLNDEASRRKIGKRGSEYYIVNALENIGIKPSEIKFIILTHLHYDHAGGLNSFADKNTKFLVNKEELEYALVSDLCYGTDSYKRRDLPQCSNWVPLTDDVFKIGTSIKIKKVGGHTPGSQIIEITTKKKNRYMILGDIIHMHEEYDSMTTGAAALTNDFSTWQSLIRQLKFINEQTEIQYLFNHDRRMLGTSKTTFE